MALFLQDLFTESATTTLASHTPDLGGAYAKQTGYTNSIDVIGGAGYASGVTNSTALYNNAATPPSEDYYVEADIVITNVVDGYSGVMARCAAAATTFYQVYFDGSTGNLVLTKNVASTSTSVLTSAALSWTVNTQKTIRLEVSGTSISAFVDGALVLGPITDTAISATGRAGVRTRQSGRILELRAGTLTSGTTITCNQGSASAVGYAASIIAATTIACALGSASGTGYQATVQVGSNTTIACALGQASALGYTATVSVSGSVTLSSDVFKNNAGTVLAGVTVPKVWLVPLGSPDFTNLVTNGSGVLTITTGTVPAGDYLLVSANADGTVTGSGKVTAS